MSFLRALGVALAAFLLPLSAHATQILVYSTADVIAAGDGCSLREAIINANTDSKSGSVECGRGAGADTIILPPDTIRLLGTTIEEDDPATNDLDITSDITILGGSGAWSILDGWNSLRLIDVHPGAKLTMRGVKLLRGATDTQGGALLIEAGAQFIGEYVDVTSSFASATGVGVGGGVYVATGATASFDKSEISDNRALGDVGAGAGVYCASGCTLTMKTTTVTGNIATVSGGGVEVAAGGQADFSFVTVGRNMAASGAGIHVDGGATLFASLMGDNGAGAVGADLECTLASTVTSSSTFVEFPGAACPLVGITERSETPVGMPAGVLLETTNSPYEGAPGRTHQVVDAFAPYVFAQVPYTDSRCATLLDEHGRQRVPGTSCDLGAFQNAMVSIWKMGFGLSATDGPKSFFMHLGDPPTALTTVRIQPVGGIGEDCAPFTIDVVFAVGETLQTFFVDPLAIFPAPGLNRPSRVCELSATVVSGSFVGATAGNIRARVSNGSASTIGFSSPGVGAYLDFGTVPVSVGGLRSLWLTPDVSGFAVTNVRFLGLDAGRFEIATAGAAETPAGSGNYVFSPSVPVLDFAGGGTTLQVRCKPGQLGDYDAEMVVYTDSLTYTELHYGVRCRESHVLTMSSSALRIGENAGVPVQYVLSLDSPNLLAPFDVSVTEEAGTATSGVDYSPFARTVTFATGQQQAVIDVNVIDDLEVEADETFTATMHDPHVEYLQVAGAPATTVTIGENDVLSRGISVTLLGVPDHVDPGVLLDTTVTVVNTGNAALHGVRVELKVQQPMWIRSFALAGASCSIDSSKRAAVCDINTVLAPDGGSTTVYGKILTADMNEPPTLDVRGALTVSARAGTPSASAESSAAMTIDAPPLSTSGGAAWPGVSGMLLLVSLLAGRHGRWSAGRKAGRAC